MQEPFGKIYWFFVTKSFPTGVWQEGIKRTHDAIYIGTNQLHVTILRNTQGFHLTRFGNAAIPQNGETGIGHIMQIVDNWAANAHYLSPAEQGTIRNIHTSLFYIREGVRMFKQHGMLQSSRIYNPMFDV